MRDEAAKSTIAEAAAIPGFRLVQFKRTRRGDTYAIIFPDLIRTGLHISIHPTEVHLKTPNPPVTSVIEAESVEFKRFLASLLSRVRSWSRPPTPGFRTSVIVLPGGNSKPFSLESNQAELDLNKMFSHAWGFSVDQTTTMVRVLAQLRAGGKVRDGDFTLAWTRRLGEFSVGVLMNPNDLPTSVENSAEASDAQRIRQQTLESGAFFVTIGKPEKEEARRLLSEDLALLQHLKGEMRGAFGLPVKRRGRLRGRDLIPGLRQRALSALSRSERQRFGKP